MGAPEFLYAENPAIVAGFRVGYADREKTTKKRLQNACVSKAPSGRELSSECETEGESAPSIKQLQLGERKK